MTTEFRFSKRSLDVLNTVDQRLYDLANRALLYSEIDFGVISGLRTKQEQEHLMAIGASKTMNSKHLTGHAIDIMAWIDGRPCWEVGPYRLIHPAFEVAAHEIELPIKWGGEWGWDFGHYEIEGGA